MIIRERDDRNSIDEIHCDNAAVSIRRTPPDRFEMTASESGTDRRFAYRAEQAGNPITMAVEDDVEYRAAADGVTTQGRLSSEQMDPGYYWVGIREEEPSESEVSVHIRTQDRAKPIVCEEITSNLTREVAAQAGDQWAGH